MKSWLHILALGLALSVLTAGAVETNSNSLPKVDEVLSRVLERAKAEGRDYREFRNRYAFTRTRTTETRNGKGALKSQETRKSEHIPKPQPAPASVSVPPSDDSRDHVRVGNDVRPDASGDIKGKAFDQGDFPLTADLVKRFQFTLAGREMLGTRPALLVDFRPASGNLPVRNLKDRFINRSAGRAWIDEKDFALVKVDLHLTEPVSVVGGLVGAVRKCNYNFHRERTAEGLWFTAQVDWHLEGRQFLATKTIDHHEKREQVRKVW